MTENENILAGLLKNVHSWTDLKPLLSEYNTTETGTTKKNTKAGKLFELFSKLCFEHDSNFKEEYNIKKAYLYEELPDDLKQQLKIGNIEHGIDLILIGNDDQTIAVQCKFKNDEGVKLNWNSEKLGNFFGFARNANFHIVISNSSDITDVAKNLTADFKFLGYSYLKDLSADTFQIIRNVLANKTEIHSEKPKPRLYQEEAITAVINHFKENERGQLILPCGAGKTLTSLWIKEALNATNTLVLVPSLALLRQIKKEWNKSFNEQFIRLNVCSEKDIDSDKNVETDALIVHTYEIPGNVTSDKNDIANFLKQQQNKVVFCTYQSLQAVIDALELIPEFEFDLVLADEAHKTAGFADQNKFTLVHNPDKVRSARRLYMTATPRIASAELKKHHKDRLMYLKDMSNPKVFGKEAYRMTFGTAIDKGILVNYKIIAVGVSDSDLKKNIDKNIVLTKTERIIDYAHNYALNVAMEKYNAFHALTFHSRVELARRFAERHPKLVPNIHATSISGEQTTSEREKILDTFKTNERAVVSNARCLTEGVDVPAIDMVYYGDPKNSKIDIVQSAGRALRTGRIKQNGVIVNKEWGFIVVPIFHKDKETVDEAIDKSQYKNLITVIRSLCDQDERLEAEINELAWNKENKPKKGTIEFTFSDDETDKVIHFEKIKEKLKKSLFNQIIDNLKDPWEIHYKQLVEYFQENGHTDIPARHKHKGFALGTWAVSQRAEFRKNRLSDREIKLLEKIDFDFDPQNFYRAFIIELKAYLNKHGNVDVMTQSKDYPKLGRWVNKTRMIYANGKPDGNGNIVWAKHSTLLKEQIEELNSLGFIWTKRKNNWDDNFQALKKFYELNGHSSIGPSEDQPLYNWRYGVIKRQKNLTALQRKKLASIEFDYTVNRHDQSNEEKQKKVPAPTNNKTAHDYQWDIMLEKLKLFKEQNNHFLIPKNTKENKKLSAWAITQRIARNNKKLSQERIDRLNLIEFPWALPKGRKKILNNSVSIEKIKIVKPKKPFIVKASSEEKEQIKWLKMFDALLTFKIKNDHTAIPRTSIENQRLAYWLIKQRKLFRAKKLPQEKIDKFNHVGIDLGYERKDAYRKMWMEKYNQYIEFKSKNGDKEPSAKKKGIESLGQWVLTQRWERKKKIIEKYKIELLDKIDFDWERGQHSGGQPDDEQWFENLKQLEAYKNKFGDCNVSQLDKVYKKLGRWLNDQRVSYSRNKLHEHRKDLLNEIGVVWNTKEYEWDLKLKMLNSFYQKHRHFNVKQSDKEFGGLYNWIYKIKRLGTTKEKKQRLKDIGYDTTEIKINEDN